MFDGVVVAVDGTRAGNEAGRQAANLVAPGGLIRLVGVADPYSESINEWGGEALLVADAASRDDAPARMQTALRDAVARSLDALRAQLPAGLRVDADVVEGRVRDVLQAAATDADLIALGDHGRRRIPGIIAASTVTEMLHRSACSVLISRPCFDPARFPARIAVAVDGSGPSLRALETGVAIAGAGGAVAHLEAVVAGRGADAVATVVNERGGVPVNVLSDRAEVGP